MPQADPSTIKGDRKVKKGQEASLTALVKLAKRNEHVRKEINMSSVLELWKFGIAKDEVVDGLCQLGK